VTRTVELVDAPGALARPLDPAEVYRELSAAVLGYLRAQSADDPEDLAADVFYQVVRDLHRFHGDDAALRRWVFTIAHHRLVDQGRRRRRRPTLVADENLEGRPAVEAEGMVDRQLIDALRRLTRAQRDVVVLRFVADLPIADVARLLHRRQSAVKSLQLRALAHLSAALAGDGAAPRDLDRR
jgi:RNA polymerase sigma-70 factor (ECF subfamily)